LPTKLTDVEEELDAIASSAVKTAKDLNEKCIILITMTGKAARVVASKRLSVPVLAFCTDQQVARKLQLHRGICPMLLQTVLDPTSNLTKVSFTRAEAVRTAKEVGIVAARDRVVTIDRTTGKSYDTFDFSHNIKLSTVKDM
jgi:pyruvate kinase